MFHSIKVALGVRAHFLGYWGGRPDSIVGKAACHINMAKVIGRKFFHSRCISWSYRNRGYDARAQRKKIVSTVVFSIRLVGNMSGCVVPGFRNRMHVRVFIIIMFVYSARKNRAKGPAAYSTLNPETSSDSPSVRSKGARLVSASVEMSHIMARGQVQASNQW